MKELEKLKSSIEYQNFKVGTPEANIRVDPRVPPQAREIIFREMEENLSKNLGHKYFLGNLDETFRDAVLYGDEFFPVPNPLIPYGLLSGEKSLQDVIRRRQEDVNTNLGFSPINLSFIPYSLSLFHDRTSDNLIEKIDSETGLEGLHLGNKKFFLEIPPQIKKDFINLLSQFVADKLFLGEGLRLDFNPSLLDNKGCIQMPTLRRIVTNTNRKLLTILVQLSPFTIKLKEVKIPFLPDIFRYTIGVIDQQGWRIEFDQEKFNQRNPRG